MNFGSTELKPYPTNVTKDEENPASAWNCSLCQAKCTRQSELENHLKGKRHQLNFLVLQVEGQQYLSDWRCGICLAKCKSASQFEDHCSGRGHKQKIDALLRGGTNARSSAFQADKKPPSDGSDIKGGISEQETVTQRTLYSCKLCNLHCNSKNTLAEHRRGRKHIEKVEKRMSLSYCEVCNLQCNSEKMLAHHCTGKTHLAKVNGWLEICRARFWYHRYSFWETRMYAHAVLSSILICCLCYVIDVFEVGPPFCILNLYDKYFPQATCRSSI